jgi:hypothetical protein
VDGVAGKQMWGRQYNREISDLSRLEEEISGDVVHQIRSNLTSRETSKLAVGKSVKPEAYELLLRGRYQMRLYSPESTSKAISYFEQAIMIDPHYALAEVELANVYRRMAAPACSIRGRRCHWQRQRPGEPWAERRTWPKRMPLWPT